MDSNERLVLELAGGGPPAELPRSGVLVVGSSPQKAGFLVEGQGVSGVHCAIGRASGGGWAIKDLGSDFGTLVNGKKVQTARLREGDQILLGSRRLAVRRHGSQAPAGAARGAGGAQAAPPKPTSTEPTRPAPTRPERASAEGATATAAVDPALTRSQIAPPPRIGGYRIERLLGRGAQGNVYLAVQESLARQVALKVLSAAVERDSEFVQRFQAEARAAAALNHPNVVTVHDVGEFEGHHYLSMEYMDRGSLEERVAAEGALPWRIALDALVDASAGLVFAESRGIVHRDIKPANLMQNASGVTKIADLGLAAHAESELGAETEGGRKIFGTPHFIAPEQVLGERADARSDLYSLGATAYRLLTGHTPFEGQSSREILRALLRDEPARIDELVSGVPAELVAAVTRLMSKERERRHPSAAVLHAELLALQHRDQGLAAVGGAAQGRRSSLPLILGLTGAALVGLTLFVLVNRGSGPAPAPPEPIGTSDDRAPAEPFPVDLDAPLIDEPEGPRAPADTDTQLKLLETEAELELLRLAQAGLSDGERIPRLRELATRFAGTSSATLALEEADRIAAELARIEREEGARLAAIDAFLNSRRTAAALGTRPLDVGEALRAVRDSEPPLELADDELLARRLVALQAEVVQAGIAQTAAALQRSEELTGRGEFDAGRAELDGARRRLDLPVFNPEDAPQDLERLLGLRGQVRRRLEAFDQLRLAALAELGRADAARIAAELRGPAGLEGELGRMDLGAAQARLERLLEGTATEDLRSFVAALQVDLDLAAEALASLSSDFESWRRLLVPDPRDRRAPMREARGASAQGILVDGAELIPWAAFAGRPRDLHAVFHERLSRSYSEDELLGICALLRLQAVVETLRTVAGALDPAQPSSFSERMARELPEPFGPAVDWAPTPAARGAAQAEREAARLLAESLRQGSLGSWPRAVASLERLLEQHADTLLVRLLSDGRALAPPAVVADPPAPERAPEDPAAASGASNPSDAPPPSPTDDEGGPDEGGDSTDRAG